MIFHLYGGRDLRPPVTEVAMRRAFTLIEVLVVISIIGVLIALLVPAVQSARGAARRAQCQNNLKQIGLAVASYTANKNVLPMGAVAGTGHGVGQSWIVLILPELEQRPLYNAYNFSVENFDMANGTVVGTRLGTLLCPENPVPLDPVPSIQVSRADGSNYPTGSAFARMHYAANWGGSNNPMGEDFTKTKQSYRGVMMTVRVAGPRGNTNCLRPQDIRDGMANTLMIVEKPDSQGWAVGGYAGAEFDVGPAPNMNPNPDANLVDPFVRKAFSGSFHPGQVISTFCDGSVRALRSGMDKELWYSVITRDGREVINVDAL